MKIIYEGDGFEITKHELLAVIIIIVLMLVIGIFITDSLRSRIDENNRQYMQATQINADKELFEYGMRTDVGNAFIYGELKAIDTVSTPGIKGEYSYIDIHEEEYTMHTRVVTYTDSKGHTHTTTETYWTWDMVGREKITCNKISFLEHEFQYGQIHFPTAKYIDTVYKSSHRRYVYYACALKYVGTIYTRLENNTINKTSFYENKTIDETIVYLCDQGKACIVVCWVFIIIFILIISYAFCIRENDWLEN